MSKRAGWENRVKVNGIAYRTKRTTIEDSAADLEVTDSEGVPGNPLATEAPGFYAAVPGISKGTFSLQSATFDDDDNPFSAPLSLAAGNYISVEAYPAGLTGVAHVYENCLITKIRHEMDVDGLSPVTIEGVTDGSYTLASE